MKARHARAAARRFRVELIRVLSDAGIRPGCAEFHSGMVLGYSYFHGSDPDVLARLSGFPAAYCAAVMDRCRASGIWRGQAVRCVGWDKPNSLLAFVLDAMVAAGSRRSR